MSMETSRARAAYMIDAISESVLFEAQAELDVDPSTDGRVVYFVSVIPFSPHQEFTRQLSQRHPESLAESEALRNAVVSWLKAGEETSAVRRKLTQSQRWEWGAVVDDLPALSQEIESRYELGDCETEIGWERIPGGMLIVCRILPRMWEGSGLPYG